MRPPALAASSLALPALAAAIIAACGNPPAGDDDDGDASATDAPAPDAPAPDAPTSDANLDPLPDIFVVADRASVDFAIEERTFAPDACELDPAEDCIGAAGDRTLLRFAVQTPNIGNADMFLGAPDLSNPNFVWSPCHEHFHFEGYAEYRLLDADGNEVAEGQKQAFCLLDSEKWLEDDPTVGDSVVYQCNYQGIQRGWSDVYHARLACQYIDVTGVPPGDYTLRISLNNEQSIEELRFDNNVAELPVSLGDAAVATPTEACALGIDPRITDGGHRECGWTHAGTFDCTPGTPFRVGCTTACGAPLGTCTGDPMLRVCDAARPDGNCSYAAVLADDDDSCNSQCPRARDVVCPPSGQVDVYTGAYSLGDPYTCDVDLQAQ